MSEIDLSQLTREQLIHLQHDIRQERERRTQEKLGESLPIIVHTMLDQTQAVVYPNPADNSIGPKTR